MPVRRAAGATRSRATTPIRSWPSTSHARATTGGELRGFNATWPTTAPRSSSATHAASGAGRLDEGPQVEREAHRIPVALLHLGRHHRKGVEVFLGARTDDHVTAVRATCAYFGAALKVRLHDPLCASSQLDVLDDGGHGRGAVGAADATRRGLAGGDHRRLRPAVAIPVRGRRRGAQVLEARTGSREEAVEGERRVGLVVRVVDDDQIGVAGDRLTAIGDERQIAPVDRL